jgi:hypothetical protein
MIGRNLLALLVILPLAGAWAEPAAAMCGGNIFMTCPPQAAAPAKKPRAVKEHKRRYPLNAPAAKKAAPPS